MTKLLESLRHINTAFTNLMFARVNRVIVNDDDVISFTGKDGTTQWDDEPTFEEEKQKFTHEEWARTGKAVKYYYGFAEYPMYDGQSVWFSSKLHHHYCYPGFLSISDTITPPKAGDILLGQVGRAHGKHGPRIVNWHRVHPQAVTFIRMLQGRDSHFPDVVREDSLVVEAPTDEDRNHYADIARLLVTCHYQYFLDFQRVRDITQIPQRFQDCGGVDQFIKDIADMYGVEIWERFKRMMIEQGIKSKLIPVEELINPVCTVLSTALAAKQLVGT